MSDGFAGQVAWVTGAGAGLGYAVAAGLARAGARVAVNDIDPALAAAAAARINAACGAELAHAFPGDVADVAAVRAQAAAIGDRLGPPAICLANAGITMFGGFLDYEPEQFDQLMAVNLRGSYFTAQAAARAMLAAKLPGRIVLMASVTGMRAVGGLGTYGISKAGIIAMARSLAFELGPHGITVNAVAPGATITERTLQETPNYEADWAAVTPDRRAGQAEDVAAAVLFLASPAARHMNGQTLVVDGGWSGSSPLPAGY
jgi:3-oxoacyl-[acyl-carrier protein] reductase